MVNKFSYAAIHFMKLLVRPVNSDFCRQYVNIRIRKERKHEERICRYTFSSAVTLFVCVI
jgi:hypothetical protein